MLGVRNDVGRGVGMGGATDDPRAGPAGHARRRRDRAEEAEALRLYARARSGAWGAWLLGAVVAFALFAQLAEAHVLILAFAPAAAVEAAERALLRRLAALSDERLLRSPARALVPWAAALNATVTAGCLLLLSAAAGEAARPLAVAVLLCLSVYAAMVHGGQPRLHLIRQAPLLAAFAAAHAEALSRQWPEPSRAALTEAAAAAMLAVMLAVIYLYMHRQARRRGRALRELRSARREAELRSRTLERVRDRAERAALHDPLTGLPNRRYLERMVESLRETDGPAEIAMLLIDLDRFKTINDTLGHDAGDAVLRRMARLLLDNLREGDFVARIGGDEFVVLAPCEGAGGEAEALAARLIAAARLPLPYGDQICRFGASVGIARAPRAEARLEPLLIKADIALYRAKALGRGRAEPFTPALQAEAVAAKRLGDDILRGLEAGEFAPFYQPVLRAADGGLAAVEAVARWRHPERGLLGPPAFLSAAAEIGALAEIDGAILRRALADRAALSAAGAPPPPISVNVSAARLAEPDLADEVAAAGLPPGALAFELGDSVDSAARDRRVRRTLDRLGELGVELEIDDFGAGPASVAMLAALRPRRLKIDRSFIAPLLEAPERRALVAALIDLARSLGLGVTAEGVETAAHAEALREMGCGRLQGFAVAPPMPAEALADWLRRRAGPGSGTALTPAEAAYIRTARQ